MWLRSNITYPIFIACTGAAVIFLTSYALYTVDKLPGHSPTTGLGTRLALSQLYMQYATVVSYPGCLVEKNSLATFVSSNCIQNHVTDVALQLWILDNIMHMMFEGSHVTVCNIQAYCCSQQALLPTFTWWEPPHLSSVNAPLAVDSQSFTTSIWPTEQVLASQATALSMGSVHSYTEVRRSMNKAHRLCLVHFKCLVYCDRCNRNSITVMWQRSEIWLLLPPLWQWN